MKPAASQVYAPAGSFSRSLRNSASPCAGGCAIVLGTRFSESIAGSQVSGDARVLQEGCRRRNYAEIRVERPVSKEEGEAQLQGEHVQEKVPFSGTYFNRPWRPSV